METEKVHFEKVAEAIRYIVTHYKEQPDLDAIAEKVNVSPLYFQKIFSEWAGISPKKFVQFLTVEYAKSILDKGISLADTAYLAGLSGSGRLHDLFITMEAMTPGEFKSGGKGLQIEYHFGYTLWGNVMVATTPKGVCMLTFIYDEISAVSDLKHKFPKAELRESFNQMHNDVLGFFKNPSGLKSKIHLHLKATDFQLKVWQALLKVPSGDITSYGRIASQIGLPLASRAVGTAVGDNPIAVLIPCHRIIQASGAFGNYMWGPERKLAILGWEANLINPEK